MGTYHYANGVRFVGGFVSDVAHGPGTYYSVDGKECQNVEWKEGRLISETQMIPIEQAKVKLEPAETMAKKKVEVNPDGLKEAFPDQVQPKATPKLQEKFGSGWN